MAWSELLESHGGSLDSLGRGKVRRRFRCWNGVTVAAILQDPGSISNDAGQFLPVPGSPHPDYIDQSMVLDHYECDSESVSVIAVAIYSNELGGGSITPNPDKRIGTSFERRNITLYYGRRKMLDRFQNDPEPVERWEVPSANNIENFMRLTYRVIVPKKDPYDPNKPCWDGKTAEAIRAAIGEIHHFGFDGAPVVAWQFSGADPSDRNLEDAVTVVYEWVRDAGTVDYAITYPGEQPPDDPKDSPFVLPPKDKLDGFGNKFVRPPFTSLVWAIDSKKKKDKDGNDIAPTFKPVFYCQQTSVINPQGWKALPGIS